MDANPADAPVPGPERPGASRLRILELLRRAGTAVGVQQVAAETGLHPNTVRFHLQRLVADGLVMRGTQPAGRAGRPGLSFVATPRPDLDPQRRSFRQLAELLAGALATSEGDVAAEAEAIGLAWARVSVSRTASAPPSTEAEGMRELLRVLDEVGFAPEQQRDATGYRVLLRHCPFLEVAEAHREVVCSVHLGLMRGVIAETHAPLVADELRPFALPAGCVARMVVDRGTAGPPRGAAERK